MKGIIILTIIIAASLWVRELTKPIDWDAEFKKDSQLALSKYAEYSNKNEKGKVDNDVMFDGAEVTGPKVLTATFTHQKLHSRNASTAYLGHGLPALMQTVCADKTLDPIFRNGVTLKVRLKSMDNQTLFVQRVNRDKCVEQAASAAEMPVSAVSSDSARRALMKCRDIPPGEERDVCVEHYARQ